MNDALGATVKELELRAKALAKELDDARKKAADNERDASEARKLRESNIALEDRNARLKDDYDQVAPLLETSEGKKFLALHQELTRTRYWAYGGWFAAALLGLGCAAFYLYYKPLMEDAPAEGEHTPHRIE
jgi:hypothetical protein